ncbi:O-antigen ligase family protein [Patescibacteria group bacterium]
MLKHLKLSDQLIKYWLAAIFIFIPLYPKFPFIRIPGTYVAIRVEDFLIAILAVFVAIRIAPRLKEIFTKDKIVRSVTFLLLIGLASLVSAILVTKTITPYLGILHWVRRIEYFVPLIAGMYIFRKEKGRANLEFYLKILMVVVFFLFLYGFGQKHFNFPVIITQNEEYSKGIALRWIPGSHINSTFAGHYDLASFMVIVLPILASLFLLLKGIKTKVAISISFFAGLWLLVNSASRISLVSYLLATSIAFILIKKKKAIIPLVLITLIFSTFSSDLIARYNQIIDVAVKKITLVPKVVLAQDENTLLQANPTVSTPTPTPQPVFEDRSTSIRLNVEWPRAIRGFIKNPLVGTGYSSITLATDNDFLRLLGEIGILGFVGFLLILFRIAKVFAEACSCLEKFSAIKRAFIAGMVGGSVGILTNAFFIDIFEASKFAIIFWLLIGYGIYLVKTELNEQNNEI